MAVELLGANSKRDNVTKLLSILAGEGRDRLPARPTRSRQFQRRFDDQELAQLLAGYEQGARVNDLAEIFGVSRSSVMANLSRLGAESRRGIVHRRIEEARALYEQGWSLAQVGDHFGVHAETVRLALRRAGVQVRRRSAFTY